MKNTMCFMRGMGIGLAAGMATAAAVKCVCMKSKKFRKRNYKLTWIQEKTSLCIE